MWVRGSSGAARSRRFHCPSIVRTRQHRTLSVLCCHRASAVLVQREAGGVALSCLGCAREAHGLCKARSAPAEPPCIGDGRRGEVMDSVESCQTHRRSSGCTAAAARRYQRCGHVYCGGHPPTAVKVSCSLSSLFSNQGCCLVAVDW